MVRTNMSHLKQFNTNLINFVGELKNMNLPMKSELIQLENFLEITNVNARSVISIFQRYFLRDLFVQNILKNNIGFFIMYDDFEDIPVKDREIAVSVIGKIQNIAKDLKDKNDTSKISVILKNLKVLSYFAYSDLGLDANKKFKDLLST